MSTPYDPAEVLEWRRGKDDYFASGRGPVDAANFSGLSYYPPDPAWAFELEVVRAGGPAVTLDTSTGEPREMALYGTVTLPREVGGETLGLYVQPGEDAPQALFLPFRDATSGGETYGAGRYLEAPLRGEVARLDFNRAYHPFCLYSARYSCLLPPRENTLGAAVRAGERLP